MEHFDFWSRLDPPHTPEGTYRTSGGGLLTDKRHCAWHDERRKTGGDVRNEKKKIEGMIDDRLMRGEFGESGRVGGNGPGS